MSLVSNSNEEKKVMVELTESELRYLLAAGYGLLQNVPEGALSTYTNFTSSEIKKFSKRVKDIMEENNISI